MTTEIDNNENIGSEETPKEGTTHEDSQATVDWDKIDADTIPHAVAQKTQTAQGILNDLREQREHTARLSEENERLRAAATESEAKPDPLELDPEDYATGAQIKEMLSRHTEEIVSTLSARDAATAKAASDARLRTSAKRVRSEMTTEKAGKGLSAAEVFNVNGGALGRLQQSNPALVKSIVETSDDPARELYDACLLLDPQTKKAHQAQQAKSLKGQIRGETGGAVPAEEVDDLEAMLQGVLSESDADAIGTQADGMFMRGDDG
jgi:hypothetical protein